jgi:hypothetical protein
MTFNPKGDLSLLVLTDPLPKKFKHIATRISTSPVNQTY